MRRATTHDIGSFRATIGGAFSALVDGPASFSPRQLHDLPEVALHVHGETGGTAIDLLYLGRELPVGVGPVADLYRGNPGAGEWVAIISTRDHDKLREPFFSLAGQVRVSRSRDDRLSGTFALEARSGPDGNAEAPWVSVAGDFSAVPATLELPLFTGRVTWEWDFSDIAEGVD